MNGVNRQDQVGIVVFQVNKHLKKEVDMYLCQWAKEPHCYNIPKITKAILIRQVMKNKCSLKVYILDFSDEIWDNWINQDINFLGN